jgi:hypothetical protein
MFKRPIAVVVSVICFLFFVLTQIANFFAIAHLPVDLRDALIAMSHVPTLLAWAIFGIGILTAAYLAMEHFKKPKARSTPSDLAQRRAKLIRDAREFVITATAKDGVDTDFKEKLETFLPFFELRPHFSESYLSKLNAQRTVYVPRDGTRLPALASWFLDEIDRLEKEWSLQ